MRLCSPPLTFGERGESAYADSVAWLPCAIEPITRPRATFPPIPRMPIAPRMAHDDTSAPTIPDVSVAFRARRPDARTAATRAALRATIPTAVPDAAARYIASTSSVRVPRVACASSPLGTGTAATVAASNTALLRRETACARETDSRTSMPASVQAEMSSSLPTVESSRRPSGVDSTSRRWL